MTIDLNGLTTVASAAAPSPTARAGRELVSPALFAKLAARVVTDDGLPLDRAERVVDQALAFLGACAVASERLVPSVQVDPGWHAFVLHTREYAEFCERIAGRFLHHDPTDPGDGQAAGVAATVAAIHAAGFAVDPPLWNGDGAGCQGDDPPAR